MATVSRRLYYVRIDPATGQAEQDSVTGKFIAYRAPKGFEGVLIPANLLAFGFIPVLLDDLSGFSQDCGIIVVPVTGSPVAKSFTPPRFSPGSNYSWNIRLDEIAEPYAGTSLTNLRLDSNRPSYVSFTSASSSSGTNYFLQMANIPANVTSIPLTFLVDASNGKTAAIPFNILEYELEDIYGFVQKSGNKTTVRIGPNKPDEATPAPLITHTGPAGYTSPGTLIMDAEQTFSPVIENKTVFFKKDFFDLLPGVQVDKIEYLGQTLYCSYTINNASLTAKLIFSTTAPGIDPGTTIPAVWPAFSQIDIKATETWSAIMPGSGFTSAYGLKKIEVVGTAPEGFSLFTNSSGLVNAIYTVPNNQPQGVVNVKLRITENNDKTIDNTLKFNVESLAFFTAIQVVGPTSHWAFLGPKKATGAANPRFRVVAGPSSWVGSTAWVDFIPYDTGVQSDGKSYNYRLTDLNFSIPGQWVVAFEFNGLIRYATFNAPLNNLTPLQLSITEPTGTTEITYYTVSPSAGINEGGRGYLYAYRKAPNQEGILFSGGQFVGVNLRSGTTINATSGEVNVASNEVLSDTYQQSFNYLVNGNVVYSSSFTVNDTTAGGVIIDPTDTVDHSGEEPTDFFTSGSGNITALTLDAPTSLGEGSSVQLTAAASTELGGTITDINLMEIALATATGAFVIATTSATATIGGVILGANGLLTANNDSTTGNNRPMRVRLRYDGLEAMKTVTILDTTPAVISQVWIKYNSTTGGTHNFSLIVVGSGMFEYNTLSTEGFGWTGPILSTATTPPVGNIGTSVSRTDSAYSTTPKKVQVRLVNQSGTMQEVEIPTTAGVWTKVYQA